MERKSEKERVGGGGVKRTTCSVKCTEKLELFFNTFLQYFSVVFSPNEESLIKSVNEELLSNNFKVLDELQQNNAEALQPPEEAP